MSISFIIFDFFPDFEIPKLIFSVTQANFLAISPCFLDNHSPFLDDTADWKLTYPTTHLIFTNGHYFY